MSLEKSSCKEYKGFEEKYSDLDKLASDFSKKCSNKELGITFDDKEFSVLKKYYESGKEESILPIFDFNLNKFNFSDKFISTLKNQKIIDETGKINKNRLNSAVTKYIEKKGIKDSNLISFTVDFIEIIWIKNQGKVELKNLQSQIFGDVLNDISKLVPQNTDEVKKQFKKAIAGIGKQFEGPIQGIEEILDEINGIDPIGGELFLLIRMAEYGFFPKDLNSHTFWGSGSIVTLNGLKEKFFYLGMGGPVTQLLPKLGYLNNIVQKKFSEQVNKLIEFETLELNALKKSIKGSGNPDITEINKKLKLLEEMKGNINDVKKLNTVMYKLRGTTSLEAKYKEYLTEFRSGNITNIKNKSIYEVYKSEIDKLEAEKTKANTNLENAKKTLATDPTNAVALDTKSNAEKFIKDIKVLQEEFSKINASSSRFEADVEVLKSKMVEFDNKYSTTISPTDRELKSGMLDNMEEGVNKEITDVETTKDRILALDGEIDGLKKQLETEIKRIEKEASKLKKSSPNYQRDIDELKSRLTLKVEEINGKILEIEKIVGTNLQKLSPVEIQTLSGKSRVVERLVKMNNGMDTFMGSGLGKFLIGTSIFKIGYDVYKGGRFNLGDAADLGAGFIPIVGGIWDLASARAGKNLLNGRELGEAEIIIRQGFGIMGVVPGVGFIVKAKWNGGYIFPSFLIKSSDIAVEGSNLGMKVGSMGFIVADLGISLYEVSEPVVAKIRQNAKNPRKQ